MAFYRKNISKSFSLKIINRNPRFFFERFYQKNRTNCINISNNVKELAEKLPRTCAEIKIVSIRKNLNEGKVKEIRVRRK